MTAKDCLICSHGQCSELELLLIRGDISNLRAAQQYGVSEKEVRLHRIECLPLLLEKVRGLQSFIKLFVKPQQENVTSEVIQQEITESRFIYSEDDFCAQTGLSRVSAWRLRKVGKLGYCQITSTKIGYRPEHIDQFLKDSEKKVRRKG